MQCNIFSTNHILSCFYLGSVIVLLQDGWGRFENTSKASLGGRSTQTTNTNPDTPLPPKANTKLQTVSCHIGIWQLSWNEWDAVGKDEKTQDARGAGRVSVMKKAPRPVLGRSSQVQVLFVCQASPDVCFSQHCIVVHCARSQLRILA